jgi:hypothetical protein
VGGRWFNKYIWEQNYTSTGKYLEVRKADHDGLPKGYRHAKSQSPDNLFSDRITSPGKSSDHHIFPDTVIRFLVVFNTFVPDFCQDGIFRAE